MATFVGKPLPRLEDARFLTGQASFTADLDLPDQAHAVVVRSPHAHAGIEGIEVAAARAAPGVLAVHTSADLGAAGIGAIPSLTRTPPFRFANADGSEMADAPQYPLARERVRYVGEPVAVVVAETLAQARMPRISSRSITGRCRWPRRSRLRLPTTRRCSGRSCPAIGRFTGRWGIARPSPRSCAPRPMSWSWRSSIRGRSSRSWSRAPRSAATTAPRTVTPCTPAASRRTSCGRCSRRSSRSPRRRSGWWFPTSAAASARATSSTPSSSWSCSPRGRSAVR